DFWSARKECTGCTRLTNRQKSARDMRGDGNFGSTNRLGHSLALFFISFGHDGAPSLPQELKKITQQLTALPLTFIVEPALNRIGPASM
ncbi:hypothetical protein, partial [uncultured Muribaculum sp.]|uniref:hypothetical protein n=1 Tax=uncultured Muribaculum sp. TaxID=1918613 RepID=UPI00265ED154